MFIKDKDYFILKNEKGKIIGIKTKNYKCTISENEKIKSKTLVEMLQVLKEKEDFYKRANKAYHKEQQKKETEKRLKAFLNKINNKNYLNINEMLEVSKKSKFKIFYIYDLLGVMEFKETRNKTLKGIDSRDNIIYFNNKNLKDYKFYKEGLIIIN